MEEEFEAAAKRAVGNVLQKTGARDNSPDCIFREGQ